MRRISLRLLFLDFTNANRAERPGFHFRQYVFAKPAP
jgi:hypothetical protein